LIVVGEDPLALLEKVLPLVVYVHASDRLGENIYQHGVPGTGLVEFNRIFALLQKNNYTGWISVEYNGTGGVEALRTAIDFIRNNYKG
jgi:sugar phosphate isomerase/epimerase